MHGAEANIKLEELIGYFDGRKQKYTTSTGLVKNYDSDRYWRLDGIEAGLKMAWRVINTSMDFEDIKKEK